MLRNLHTPNPASILMQHYLTKVKTDAEQLSKKGISSKTYDKKDLDCSLGMLSSLLSTMYKIRIDTSLTTEETITFTWK